MGRSGTDAIGGFPFGFILAATFQTLFPKNSNPIIYKMAIEVLTNQERNRRNYSHKGQQPGNRTLNRRTQPNGRTNVSRLGYNSICTSYTPDNSIDRLSGSSLCRLYQKRRKNELQKIREEQETLEAEVRGTIHELQERREAVLLLQENIRIERRNQRKISNAKNGNENGLHVLSPRSKGKIKDKATAFFRACCKKRRTFATLTFLDDVDDKAAVKILNSFFTTIRKHHPDFKYLWVAERQENENIHFHCLFNMYMDVKYYNSLWVICQYNAGLVFFDPFREETIKRQEIILRHNLGTMHEILNPFDIERVKSIYGISYYLTKYITKNKSKGFDCLAWHCSRVVSRMFTKAIVAREVQSMAANPYINFRLNKKTGEIFTGKMEKGRFHLLFYIENKVYFLQELSEMEQVNKWILGGWVPDCVPEMNQHEIFSFSHN